MPRSSPDPETLVTTVIADLPDRFWDFTVADLDAMHDLGETLLEMQIRARDDEEALIDRLKLRGWPAGKTIRDVSTEAEFAEGNAATRRYLAVERAQAGLHEYQRRIGVPWPVPDLQMTTTEDPDGSLVFLLPREGA